MVVVVRVMAGRPFFTALALLAPPMANRVAWLLGVRERPGYPSVGAPVAADALVAWPERLSPLVWPFLASVRPA